MAVEKQTAKTWLYSSFGQRSSIHLQRLCEFFKRKRISDQSMSRKGNPYDNAAMESFMKTLKYNEVYLKNYDTLTDVLRHLPYFIEEGV